MYDWKSSILPHRCKNCGRWIKPGTNHVIECGWEIVEGRYCDPICARKERKKREREQEERDELNRIIHGVKE